jgi:hypothetical protein
VELAPFFTERPVEINQIRQLFQPSRSRTTVVLHDLDGIGKTQIALEAEKQLAAAIQETRESKQQCTSASYKHVLASMNVLVECYKHRGEQGSLKRCLKLVEKCQREALKARQGGLNV